MAADHETRTREGDHLALRLWLRLLSCSQRVETELRQRLRERFDGSLPRFDLMAQLDRHPQGLKMRELSQRLMVTGGNVTGLTDRLVAEGLVERQEDASDRRAFSVRLTDEGRRQFRLMAREHEAWVADLLGGISPADQGRLFELLGGLKRTLPTSGRRAARPGGGVTPPEGGRATEPGGDRTQAPDGDRATAPMGARSAPPQRDEPTAAAPRGTTLSRPARRARR